MDELVAIQAIAGDPRIVGLEVEYAGFAVVGNPVEQLLGFLAGIGKARDAPQVEGAQVALDLDGKLGLSSRSGDAGVVWGKHGIGENRQAFGCGRAIAHEVAVDGDGTRRRRVDDFGVDQQRRVGLGVGGIDGAEGDLVEQTVGDDQEAIAVEAIGNGSEDEVAEVLRFADGNGEISRGFQAGVRASLARVPILRQIVKARL